MYEYNAQVIRVIDGDTLIMDIDLGFHVHKVVTIRLADIDCPEPRGDTVNEGLAAERFAQVWCQENAPLVVATDKDRNGDTEQGGFGRYLGTVWSGEMPHVTVLNEELVNNGHAVWKEY